MWIIDLPRVGSADEPTPCRGDLRFTSARSPRTVRDCQAICAGCPWLRDCRQLAATLLAQGEPITGIWAGIHYGVDNEKVSLNGRVDNRSGGGHRPMVDHPPRIVRLVGSATASAGSHPAPGLPIPAQRRAEPW